jgi:hypothetical protein
VRIPDSKIAPEVTRFIHDTESDLLFHHSIRVYFWGVTSLAPRDLTNPMFASEIVVATNAPFQAAS